MFEKTQISSFIKICPVGVELFDAHEQTDRHDEYLYIYISKKKLRHDEVNSRLSQFSESAQKANLLIAVFFFPEIHINALCAENVTFLNVKPGGI
jgi:hypothetical protein